MRNALNILIVAALTGGMATAQQSSEDMDQLFEMMKTYSDEAAASEKKIPADESVQQKADPVAEKVIESPAEAPAVTLDVEALIEESREQFVAGKFVESQEDITRWFLEADIFLLSSIYEGLPLSILEAMRAGLPVISTNVGGVSEAVIDGVTGFLVNSGDEHMLESRINQLIDDFELRKKFSENGFQYYQENFRASQMCTKTSKVYDTLIGQI